MRRPILLSILALVCVLASAPAAPKNGRKPAQATNDFGVTPQTPRLIDFQNDDLSLALQVLARQAKVNLAVSDDLKDTITLRLENKTPREAIDIVIATKDLAVEEQRGTQAKGMRALYDALLAEGFTKEDAFRIVLSDRGLPSAAPKK